MKILFSEKCLEFYQPGHPESPERIKRTYEFLKKKNFKFIEPEPCSEEDLLLVHTKDHVEMIKSGKFYDPDTPNLPRVFEYARLSAGSAIQAMEFALEDENSFSLMRPPGHHVGRSGKALGATSLGFCYFNNIAIATKKALAFVSKVAIIDIDNHHGNGTQEVFQGNEKVLYVSLHKHPFYPGTGEKSEKNCLNYPLSFKTTEKIYLQTLDIALTEVRNFNPDMVAVSAGFDAHKDDPLTEGGLGLNSISYRKIGRKIASLKKPSFAVLEGGYGVEFPECVHEFLIGYSKISGKRKV
ncbi:MAG: histone deacetylase [Candidatus Aenigmarchaeota archaeon]|nr:histone deacetylase [Candidatus Aenigmarchaeota archaeon]